MATDKIVYCNIDSPLGGMIAGATDNGICFLMWHSQDDIPRILKRVKEHYGLPTAEGKHPILEQLAVELKEYFGGTRTVFSVSTDIKGTDFQRRTWHMLKKIPYGKTRSYGDLAKSLGQPGASRAVGGANGANFISIILPCHRVIGSTGGLGGYAGEPWRKKWLLEHEAGSSQSDILD